MGLIARNAEAAGIPTLCMGSALDIMKAVNPPRATFLDFPLGHTTGEPHQPERQREIMLQALEGFSSLTTPGLIKILPLSWSEGEDWKMTAMNDGDTRVERCNTPQYQSEGDRILAEQNHPAACEVCESTT